VQQQQQITNQQNVLKLHHIPDLSIPPPNLSQRQFQAPNQLPLGGLQQNIISSSTLAAALDLGGSFQVQSSSASMQRISGGGSPFKMKEAPSSCKVALRPLMSLNISLPDLKKLHPKGQKRTPTKGRQMLVCYF
jgi:hypothetical protein